MSRNSASTRITRLPPAPCLSRFTDRIENGVVVGNMSFRTNHGSPRPVRAEHSRLNSRNENAQRPHLFRQGRRDSFQRELAAVIVRQSRHRHQAAHRSHVQDTALAPLPHKWQNGLDHRNRSKDVYLELLAKRIHGAFFQCSFVSVSGIVDERIHRADAALDLFDDGGKGAGSSVTSRTLAKESPGRIASISATAFSCRTVPTTVKSACARAVAKPLPNPLLAPVTMTTRLISSLARYRRYRYSEIRYLRYRESASSSWEV